MAERLLLFIILMISVFAVGMYVGKSICEREAKQGRHESTYSGQRLDTAAVVLRVVA